MAIPVIDIFAGPGGLGEGFTSISNENGERIFQIKLSIEKDEYAQKTLELRSFFRQFPIGKVPHEYYEYIKKYNQGTDQKDRKLLFDKFPAESKAAREEAWLCELGHRDFPPELVNDRIRKALNRATNWLLIGGPPCQAYSLVGRSRNRGLFEEDHRVFLYREYLRIIATHHPAVFVMENVKGLLSAKLDGDKIFDWIKADLKNPGRLFPGHNSPQYKIYSFVKEPVGFDQNKNPIYNDDTDFLIKTESFGVPQKRHRVILLGIREDLGNPSFNVLEPKDEVDLRQIIGNLPILRSGIGREIEGFTTKGKNRYQNVKDSAEIWLQTVEEYFQKIKKEFSEPIEVNFPKSTDLTTGTNYSKQLLIEPENPLNDWYSDSKLEGILNHESRTHLKQDLARYLFSAIYLKIKGDFPKLKDYPEWLLPNHENAKGTKFADRFRTQRPDQPATTVTSHISKDGHYFIHYDPTQCRSLTVREAARIQTFPDNYFFCGARTQQYHQVGNAVPPYLARQLSEIVYRIFEDEF